MVEPLHQPRGERRPREAGEPREKGESEVFGSEGSNGHCQPCQNLNLDFHGLLFLSDIKQTLSTSPEPQSPFPWFDISLTCDD